MDGVQQRPWIGPTALGIGQEVISSSYAGPVLVNGPAQYSGDRLLSPDDTPGSSTDQEIDGKDAGILSDSLSVYSCGFHRQVYPVDLIRLVWKETNLSRPSVS